MRHDPLPDEAWGDFGRGQLQPEILAHYMSLPRAVGIPARCRDREAIHAALQVLCRFDRAGPNCVIHGGAHLGNMYIMREGRPGHWALDVTYFYISALACHGAIGVPDEAGAWEAIRAHIVYGLFYWMVNPVEWQAEENNRATAARFAWGAVDHNAPSLAA